MEKRPLGTSLLELMQFEARQQDARWFIPKQCYVHQVTTKTVNICCGEHGAEGLVVQQGKRSVGTFSLLLLI